MCRWDPGVDLRRDSIIWPVCSGRASKVLAVRLRPSKLRVGNSEDARLEAVSLKDLQLAMEASLL